MTEPQPLPGPAMNGAMLTIGDRWYIRQGGLWVPLYIPRLDYDAIVEDVERESVRITSGALVSPKVVDDEARRWIDGGV
jgi:hypothetical protein